MITWVVLLGKVICSGNEDVIIWVMLLGKVICSGNRDMITWGGTTR